jgi:hypothetical protein
LRFDHLDAIVVERSVRRGWRAAQVKERDTMWIHHDGPRRLAGITATAVLGGAIAIAAPLDASAAQKEELQNETFDVEFVLDDLCEEGDVTIHERGKVRETLFFDNDDDLTKMTLHVHATTIISSEYAEFFDRWAWAGTYDPETDTFTERGNQWNVHVGPGVVASSSGLLEYRWGDDGIEIIRSAGQWDIYPGGQPPNPCEVLFP